MSKLSAIESIIAYFDDRWSNSGLNPLPPVLYDNIDYGVQSAPQWIRLNVLLDEERQITFGGAPRTFRQFGVIIIQTFVEPNTGAIDSINLVDKVSNIFRIADINNVRFSGIRSNKVGLDGHGWYQYNVTCKFHFDEYI